MGNGRVVPEGVPSGGTVHEGPATGDPPLFAALAALPPGVESRMFPGINGLDMHVLETGAGAGRPLVVLLHGFPELAWSWRKVMPALAEQGYHVVAPDQRGYGRTTGWDGRYEADLTPYRNLNLVRDVLALVFALGHRRVAAVVGHDAGARVAACCAVARPDVFRAVALMSAPFAGPPGFPFDTQGEPPPQPAGGVGAIQDALTRLDPPRKHYQWYYSTRPADADMRHAKQGLHAFLRAYYHVKSADWPENRPHPLADWSAEALAALPRYYVMDLDRTMAEQVAAEMPSAEAIAANRWLPDRELAVYAAEYARTGFAGGLQWYRINISAEHTAELRLFSGRTVDVPAIFVAGAQDWGIHQVPGALQRMQRELFTDMPEPFLVQDAGHWVQQEQPEAVTRHLLELLRRSG